MSRWLTRVRQTLSEIESAGLSKKERILTSPQGNRVRIGDGEYINFCANNYLGLSNDPHLAEAGRRALEERGVGLSSVRFICGTQDIHKALEAEISAFFKTEDSILFNSCFDANGGVFETLLTDRDAILSDSLNHASLIDGIRLCKAKRYVYEHGSLEDLKTKLKLSAEADVRLVVTDGVFSMDGEITPLPELFTLCREHDAHLMIDECHATGLLGPNGGGTPDLFSLAGRIDLISSTLGKALGGTVGGFITGGRPLIQLLRERSRPYLFSNALPPSMVEISRAALKKVQSAGVLRTRLHAVTARFRTELQAAGFEIKPGTHPIVPVMFYDAEKAGRAAERLFELGVFAVPFSYPVVPMGQARIRLQLSAGHTDADIAETLSAFRAL